MTNQDLELFDGVDVDSGVDETTGEGADDGDLSAAEIAGIAASKADPNTPGPDVEGN